MGCDAWFYGFWTFNKSLNKEQIEIVNAFINSERKYNNKNIKVFKVGFSKDNDGPNHYCKWKISEDGTTIKWDQCEKFYSFVPWICYLIDKFFLPWGYTLNGTINYSTEAYDDVSGNIIIENNKVYHESWYLNPKATTEDDTLISHGNKLVYNPHPEKLN